MLILRREFYPMTNALHRELVSIFVVYAITLIIARGHILKGFRRIFRQAVCLTMPRFIARQMVRYDEDVPVVLDAEDIPEDVDAEGFDFISCRMCVGVWVTLAICSPFHSLHVCIAIYGASYFLATQER